VHLLIVVDKADKYEQAGEVRRNDRKTVLNGDI